MAPEDVRAVIKELFRSLGLPEAFAQHLILTGDPLTTLPSSFCLGLAAQASIGAAGLAAALLNVINTGDMQTVTSETSGLSRGRCTDSEAYYTINKTVPGGIWDNLAGTYPTKDGSYVRIHTNFPHHRAGILSILGLPSTASRESVTQAFSQWDSREFEAEAARKGMCATAMRSFAEWDEHPHAQAIKGVPPVQLIKLSDAPKRLPRNSGPNDHALEGIRVLDLTRVLAGPICGRTLAAHGADVLLVTSPKLPDLPNLDADTSRGKRTTQLDLTTNTDIDKLRTLARESDVFLQGYRPGGLADKGFSVDELAKLRPGIVCANLTAWGWDGPWKSNRGFDSLVQTATGFNVAEAHAYASFHDGAQALGTHLSPKPFPVQALDHAAAYLLAFGVTAALCKTITEGGSWEVRVSLASVGNWVRSLGRLGPDGFKNATPLPERTYPPTAEVAALSAELRIAAPRDENHDATDESAQGEKRALAGDIMLALRHPAVLSKTPVDVRIAPVRLDVDVPHWLNAARCPRSR